MTKGIKGLKYWHSRMTTAISELERLEGDDEVDYGETINTYAKIVQGLEHRREVIQRRKYK